MNHYNTNHQITEHTPQHVAPSTKPLYTREAFRAILARQPEWKIRAALEEGNIPSSHIEHAIEWLEEQEQEQEQAHQHTAYWC
jgi:hypothetical protein